MFLSFTRFRISSSLHILSQVSTNLKKDACFVVTFLGSFIWGHLQLQHFNYGSARVNIKETYHVKKLKSSESSSRTQFSSIWVPIILLTSPWRAHLGLNSSSYESTKRPFRFELFFFQDQEELIQVPIILLSSPRRALLYLNYSFYKIKKSRSSFQYFFSQVQEDPARYQSSFPQVQF
jgi:hypothetical protein